MRIPISDNEMGAVYKEGNLCDDGNSRAYFEPINSSWYQNCGLNHNQSNTEFMTFADFKMLYPYQIPHSRNERRSKFKLHI